MLDDEAFARAWVESRDRARPRGERAIRQELGSEGRRPPDDRPRPERASRGGRRDPVRRRRGRDIARTRQPRNVSWHATHAASPASRIPASGASAPTRCSPATASIPRSAARSLPRSSADDTERASRGRLSARRRERCGSVAGRLTLGVARRRLRGRRTTCRLGGAQHSTGSVAAQGGAHLAHGDWSFRRRTSAHSSTILRHARPDGRNRIWIP